MVAPTQMVVLEFNELCPELTSEFMARGLLPGFRQLYERSTVYITDAEATPPHLDPWIQWPTVHSGMSHDQHKIFDLGDGYKLREKCVAEILSDADIAVGVFGSMNMNYRALKGYLVPDPWHRLGRTAPDWLQPFYQVVATQVKESTRDDALGYQEMVRLAWFMLRHGLTIGTALEAVLQLAREHRTPSLRWRRASLLDMMQYDLFRYLNRRYHVRFATFFSNSTAHYQHYYWRHMTPEIFAVGPPPGDDESLATAILYGYQSMDQLIRRALVDYPDSTIVLCTALSQQPWKDTTKVAFRPRSFERFLSFTQIDPASATVKPVMAEQFHIVFASLDAMTRAESAIQDLYLGDRPVMTVRREGENTLNCCCDINDPRLADRLVTRRDDGMTARFDEMFYMIHTMRSGRHDPRGLLWIGNGRHEIVATKVSIVDIAPTILQVFGVPKPDYMHGQPLALRVSRRQANGAPAVEKAVVN